MAVATVARLRWAVNTSSWIPSEQEWLDALSTIQAEEVKRIGQFMFQRDAKFALVGRLLIWAGLSEHMGGASHLKQFRLDRNERGKPMLLDEQGREENTVHFNISHQGKYVVLATESNQDVGVDVMDMSRPRNCSLPEFFRIMRRQFTDREWLQILPAHCQTENKQLCNFYRFWCLKESFIKAEGSGLSYGLQNLEFVAGPEWPPCDNCCVSSKLYIKGKLMTDWIFQESMLDEHCVSVAIHASPGHPTPSNFTLVTVPWLLSKLAGQVKFKPPPTLRTEWQLFEQKQLEPS